MSDVKTYTDEEKNTYIDIESYQWLEKENARLRELIHNLANRHRWQPMMGECVCEYHQEVKKIGKSE